LEHHRRVVSYLYPPPMSTALAQAELLEKEKTINDRQRKLQSFQTQAHLLAQRQTGLERDRRRCKITVAELNKYPDEHTVYQSLGRLFVKTHVPTLKAELGQTESRCEQEIAKIVGDKQRLKQHADSEEETLRREVAEFMAAAQQFQDRVQQSPPASHK